MTHQLIPLAAIVGAKHIANIYIHVNTMGRHRKAKQLRERPSKKPTQKETTPEPTVDHTADHQNPGIGKELREGTAELRN